MEITLHLIIYGMSLLLASVFLLYEWVYLKELIRVKQVIDVDAPRYIVRMLKINLALTIVTVFFLMFLIVFELLL